MVTCHGDRFIERSDLFPHFWDRAFRLLQFDPRIDAGRYPLLRQRVDPLARLERGLGNVQALVPVRELHIGPRHLHEKGQPRSMHIDVGGLRTSQGGCNRRAVLSPHIEFVTEIQRQAVLCLPAAGERLGHQAVFAKALACTREITRHLRDQRRFHLTGKGQGFLAAGTRNVKRGTALQGCAFQPVELRIAERFPPVGGGPVRRRQAGGSEGPVGL